MQCRKIREQVLPEEIHDLASRLREEGLKVAWLVPGDPPGLPKAHEVDEVIDRESASGGFRVIDPSAEPIEYWQADGIHPNEAGVNTVIERILPSVLSLLASS